MFASLGWEAWVTLGVILLMLIALVRGMGRPEIILFGSLGPLLVLGILTPEQAFAGLSNSALLAVGALFIVAAGVENTGALSFFDRLIFPNSRNMTVTTLRLMTTTAAMSAFLNNTPIVAMLIPRVRSWCERNKVAPSKLMIPLSYAAIIGGMTTLIGTSTNLLVAGLMESSGYKGLGMFDLVWVGGPAAIATILYFGLIGYRFLPDRREPGGSDDEGMLQFLFEMEMPGGSSLVSKTVEEAGLRSLGDAFLAHVIRNKEIVPASPEMVLREGDILAFRGSPAVLEHLQERHGLRSVLESVESAGHMTLPIFEAVIAPTSRLVGRTLVDVNFREEYQGVVLGIYREDESIDKSIGRVVLQAGDLLLIEARKGFDKRWNKNREEFYLVAPRRAERVKPQPGKAPLALFILLAVITVAALGYASIVTTSFIGALAMIGTRCLRGRDAKSAVDVPVLLVIAAALGLGKAIESTGLAEAIALFLTENGSAFGVIGIVSAVYIATSLLTEVITNNAAAALMIGVGLEASTTLGAPPEAFALAVAVAASASFLSPIGYQTNMMAMAAGGYKFSDFFRVGLIVNIVVGVTTLVMISYLWL
ncbi:MAG: SLC13 family permease [Rhodothermales bacterium]|nr:SLC13 family permease [Rhodothermales bacterium]